MKTRFSLLCLSFAVIFLHSATPSAQALNPEQTVNPATGEMAFSLPLATVKGINGHDFPINLSYQAGIKYDQESSAVGLGFSYGAGAISRKAIFVRDNNTGGSSLYEVKNPTPDEQKDECESPVWITVFKVIGTIVTVILFVIWCIYTGQAEAFPVPAIVIGAIWSVGSLGVNIAIMCINMNPNDYISGGEHIPQYDAERGKGVGFFKGGQYSDLPDIYFVNTPYINGQLVWVGDRTNGYFTFQKTDGSEAKGEKSTVKIDYDPTNEVFDVILVDGTHLRFAETNRYYQHFTVNTSKEVTNLTDCKSWQQIWDNQSLPEVWWLTKVTFPDGGWIECKYDNQISSIGKSLLKPPTTAQSDRFSATTMHIGYYPNKGDVLKECFLTDIVTPNQKAHFNLQNNKLDDPWYDQAMSEYICRPVLRSIDIRNGSDAAIVQTIEFSTAYTLRPQTMNSVAPDARSLTLQSVVVKDGAGKALPPITFQYDIPNNYPGWGNNRITHPHEGPFNTQFEFHLEEKDYWGYYCPNPASLNDFNPSGLAERALRPDGTAWADAWSLKQVSFPSGMRIKWQYEANCYDSANGVAVRNDFKKKYGGGIRVKRVVSYSGTGDSLSWSYFYTDQPGVFAETDLNSSGQATVEPYPYIEHDNIDLRPLKTRGGLYAPAKVAYQLCQVVPNYAPGAANPAPNGYSAFEFITAKDYPNGGTYGEIDSSWKRSYIKAVTKYGKDNLVKEKTTYEYAMQRGRIGSGAEYNDLVTLDFHEPLNMQQSTYGIVNVKKNVRTIDGVTTVQHLKMAPDLEGEDLDTTSFIAPEYFENMRTYQDRQGDELLSAEGMESALVEGFGVAGKKDLLVALAMNTKYAASINDCQVYVWVAPDIDFTDAYKPAWLRSLHNEGRCPATEPPAKGAQTGFCIGSNIGGYGLPECEMIGGMTVSDFNANGKPDLIVAGLDHVSNGAFSFDSYIHYYIFPDLYYNTSWQLVAFTGNKIGYRMTQKIDAQPDANAAKIFPYTACAGLSDLDNDGSRDDLLFYSYWWQQSGSVWLPKAQIHIVSNIGTNGLPSGTPHEYHTTVFDAPQFRFRPDERDKNQNEFGNISAKLIDSDNSGKANDLVISGIYTVDSVALSSPDLWQYRFSVRRQMLKDISIASSQIAWSTPDKGSFTFMYRRGQGEGSKLYPPNYRIGLEYPDPLRLDLPVYTIINLQGSKPDGVIAVDVFKDTQFYRDMDGAPTATAQKSDNGRYMVAKSIAASVKYPLMKAPDKHLLGQAAGKVVYNLENPELAAYSKINVTGSGEYFEPLNFATVNGLMRGADVAISLKNIGTSSITQSGVELSLKITHSDGLVDIRPIRSVVLVSGSPQDIDLSYVFTTNDRLSMVQQLSLGVKGASGVTTTIAGLKAVLTNNFVFSAGRAVSAAATTWSPSLTTWRVDSNFAWKAELRSTGLPATSLPTFPFTDPETRGAAWKYAGSVTRYDQYARPIETAQSKGSGGGRIISSIIYGHNGLLPTASVNNANFKECGAFTCDYEKDVIVNSVNYFDYPNGWQKGGGLLTGADTKHFGERCVKLVDKLGPTRISRIDPTRDYVASAWVKVTGKLLIVAQYCNYTGTDDNVFPIPTNQLSNCDYAQDSKLVESNGGKWQYVELPIKASKKSHTNISKPCIKLMFSNSPTEIKTSGNIAYMDDLRFYPNSGQLTTTYYDTKWQQPITTVGVDGKPSDRVALDGYGRPVKWYKYQTGDHDVLQLTKKQEYHSQNEVMPNEGVRVIYPNGGESLSSGDQLRIEWTNDSTRTIKIALMRPDGAVAWSKILPDHSGNGIEYIPALTNYGGRNLRVVAIDMNNADVSDESDATFRINTCPNPPVCATPGIYVGSDQTSVYFQWSGTDPDLGDILTYKLYIILNGCSNVPLLVYTGSGTTTSQVYSLNAGSPQSFKWFVEANDEICTTRSDGDDFDVNTLCP
jgi:hypothetical protein